MTKIATLRPDLKTVAVRPTKSDPEIKVVIGIDGFGKYHPKEVHYPDMYSIDEVREKVKIYNAGNRPCKICQRYAYEKANNTKKIIAIGMAIAGIVILLAIIKRRKR